ncbi:unnamed protein product, partial [Linum tenue]
FLGINDPGFLLSRHRPLAISNCPTTSSDDLPLQPLAAGRWLRFLGKLLPVLRWPPQACPFLLLIEIRQSAPAMGIECLVLGAGQEIGKSCVIVTINGMRIMFDCGMHLGHSDEERYPDFSLIDGSLDCVVITHFHLDHIGALPYFTEVVGYNGPIYMTYPTKALAPLMLEDFLRISVGRGVEEKFTAEDISACMKKVTPIDLKQNIQVGKDLQIRAYYAGHVLGAAMVYAKVGDASMVYTGDYNMTPDRHLGAAQIDPLELDLVITESTYATTVRDSKYASERKFLKAVHDCVVAGGKVLIPTFALGRAQELFILLEDYWERMNLKVPIYFSSGLTKQANIYYKTLMSWTNKKIKDTIALQNAFNLKHVVSFDRSQINAPGPCVLFASPGMLSGGLSLEVFKQWAPSEVNLVMLPGHCVAGTIGHKLASGKLTKLYADNNSQIEIRCKNVNLSFSAHTDSKGIMDLLKFLSPKHAMLVHGEKPRMSILKKKIESEMGIMCYDPLNGGLVKIPSATVHVKAQTSDSFAKSCQSPNFSLSRCSTSGAVLSTDLASPLTVTDDRVGEAILFVDGGKARGVHKDELELELIVSGEGKPQVVLFGHCFPIRSKNLTNATGRLGLSGSRSLLKVLALELSHLFPQVDVQNMGDFLQVGSFILSVCTNAGCTRRSSEVPGDPSTTCTYFCCSWCMEDEKLALAIISSVRNSL